MTLASGPVIGFVPCLPPGEHPGMDALAEGLGLALASAGLALAIEPGDLRAADASAGQGRAIDRLVERGASAIVLFAIALTEPARAVDAARSRGVAVVTIHQSAMKVDAMLVVPNFAHGVALAAAVHQALGARPASPRVGIVGPPDILDDLELTRGILFGLQQCGLTPANDPFDPACRNLRDVAGESAPAVAHVLDSHRDLDALIVFNDETLRDAIEPLRRRGLLGRLPVVARNGSPGIVDAVVRGDVHATFDYHLPEIGHAAATLVQRVLARQVDPGAAVAAPVGRLITRATAHLYRPWHERVQPKTLSTPPAEVSA